LTPPTAPPGGRWTVLIPAHNEVATIRGVAERALAHVDRVVVIDDGSSDGTAAALDGLPVTVIAHKVNRGKGRRLAEGLNHEFEERCDGVLTLDADGQHDPDDIPAFLAAARLAPSALLMGDRFADTTGMPRARRAAISFGDFFITWAAARRIRDAQCGMRLYPASVLCSVTVDERDQAHFTFETAILLKASDAGFDIVRVPIRARYAGFQQRPSHFRPVLDTLRIVRTVTAHLVRSRFRPRGLLIAFGILR